MLSSKQEPSSPCLNLSPFQKATSSLSAVTISSFSLMPIWIIGECPSTTSLHAPVQVPYSDSYIHALSNQLPARNGNNHVRLSVLSSGAMLVGNQIPYGGRPVPASQCKSFTAFCESKATPYEFP